MFQICDVLLPLETTALQMRLRSKIMAKFWRFWLSVKVTEAMSEVNFSCDT